MLGAANKFSVKINQIFFIFLILFTWHYVQAFFVVNNLKMWTLNNLTWKRGAKVCVEVCNFHGSKSVARSSQT